MRRFTIGRERIQGDRVVFDRDESRHLARVVRLRPGAVVVATDGAGHDYTVRLEEVGERAVGHVLGVRAGGAESPLAITLVQGVPKGDRMDAIVRAVTELGVARVAPALCERTIVRLDGAGWRARARRWQRIAREAAKQSRRAVIPVVDAPRSLADCLVEVADGHLALCLWEGEAAPLERILAASGKAPGAASILVGPEGGLARAEVDAAVAAGWTVAGLGPRILRAETAGPAAVAILQFCLGDLGAAREPG